MSLAKESILERNYKFWLQNTEKVENIAQQIRVLLPVIEMYTKLVNFERLQKCFSYKLLRFYGYLYDRSWK